MLGISLSGDGMVAVPLSESDGLAGSLPEEIELSPAFFAASNRLDIKDVR